MCTQSIYRNPVQCATLSFKSLIPMREWGKKSRTHTFTKFRHSRKLIGLLVNVFNFYIGIACIFISTVLILTHAITNTKINYHQTMSKIWSQRHNLNIFWQFQTFVSKNYLFVWVVMSIQFRIKAFAVKGFHYHPFLDRFLNSFDWYQCYFVSKLYFLNYYFISLEQYYLVWTIWLWHKYLHQ